jgi:hypothetical protein
MHMRLVPLNICIDGVGTPDFMTSDLNDAKDLSIP